MGARYEATTDIRERYVAAKEEALLVQHELPGVVRMQGRDQLALLQRMSTNDLTALKPGRWDTTVFTNALGRIVDHVTVLHGHEQIYLVTSPGRGGDVAAWLQGFIFFQDDVQLKNQTGDWSLWSVIGPHHHAAATHLLGEIPELAEGESVNVDGDHLWRVADPLPGIRFLMRSGNQKRLRKGLSPVESQPQNRQVYEILRVEAGMPVFGREFAADSIPLEAGLQDAISFEKGCYIGQEIIARMQSRGQIPRRLAGLSLDAMASPGSPVFAGEKKVGQITSAVESPQDGWIALAILKSSVLDRNEEFTVGKQRVDARSRPLPFLER